MIILIKFWNDLSMSDKPVGTFSCEFGHVHCSPGCAPEWWDISEMFFPSLGRKKYIYFSPTIGKNGGGWGKQNIKYSTVF